VTGKGGDTAKGLLILLHNLIAERKSIMNRRRRRIREKRKPLSPVSLGACVAGGITLLLFVGFLLISAYQEGNTINLFGAVSVLCMIVAVAALVRGIAARRNENFDGFTRLLGVIVPGISAVSWIVLYMIGAIVG
jgi:cytoskeletal protein RodZ